jgi:drug/metabolite transporter, DME family
MIARGRVLAAAALFSTGGAAIKLASLGAPQIATLRCAIAALFLLAVLPGGRPRRDARELMIACGYAATLVLFVTANRLTTAAHAIFLQMSAPLYLLVLGPRLIGEPNQPGDALRIASIAAGVALLLASAEAPLSTAPDPLRFAGTCAPQRAASPGRSRWRDCALSRCTARPLPAIRWRASWCSATRSPRS